MYSLVIVHVELTFYYHGMVNVEINCKDIELIIVLYFSLCVTFWTDQCAISYGDIDILTLMVQDRGPSMCNSKTSPGEHKVTSGLKLFQCRVFETDQMLTENTWNS